MKILMINSVCGIRSTGRICTDIADVVKNNGHECKIAYGREDVPEKYREDSFRIGGKFNPRIHGFFSRAFGYTGFYSKSETEKFLKQVDEFKPDVIHLHNLHGYYINIKKLFDYIKKNDIPVVWTLHDGWAITGHCASFAVRNCEKWKSGCENCRCYSAYPQSYLPYSVEKNYQRKKECFTGVKNLTVVTPSEWLGNIVKESFLNEYDIQVIGNGIDTDTFRLTRSDFREKYGLTDKKMYLGVASAWGKNKGLDDFIAFSAMLKPDEKLVLVGLTSEQIKQMPKEIICIERTNSTKELAEIYSAADVFINLTYNDNFPTVNLEAVACSTPVITYNTGGSPECSYTPSCVIPQGDLSALRELLDCEKYKNALELCDRESLSKAAMAEKYMDLYSRKARIV